MRLKRSSFKLFVFFFILLFASCAPQVALKGPRYTYIGMNKITKKAHKRVEKFVAFVQKTRVPYALNPAVRIDSVVVRKKAKTIRIYFNKRFSYAPFREENVAQTYQLLKKFLGWSFRKYIATIYTLGQPIEQLIPNFFRSDSSRYDTSRMPRLAKRPAPVVRNVSRAWVPDLGLFNRNIGLWPSHGWYYNGTKKRWEWQRPRLFQTVEDLLPAAFVLPYLIPMLENAGANVFDPRERDFQINEAVVDNDSGGARYSEHARDSLHTWQTGNSAGFAVGNPPYTGTLNPFRQGTFRVTRSDTTVSSQAVWVPKIPKTGWYTVSIAYHHSPQNVTDAHYTVYHAGGKTDFRVNQQMGGETWIYLGRFKFFKGVHPDSGKVVLTNQSREPGKFVTADAVRFGGGMGNIQRGGHTSGRARFEEAARYFMQYAGMPDSLVYNLNNGKNDYKDDYQGRAEFLNYLHGAPFGPNKNRNMPGLGIPIDLSLAFHTDAGFGKGDTTVGTLSIYSILDADSLTVFPDSVSRLANRDFADILQTQIVNDLRRKWDPSWPRRALMEAQYSEVFRPNVPAALLELLSHQNFWDARFELDPRFRFDVARAIYKAMLKFLATENRTSYVVEPLPVSHFTAVFTDTQTVTLSWRPVLDPLESSAVPEKYVVYTQLDSGGFDNGRLVQDTTLTISNIKPGVIYSYKVTALNRGGESFPSEILSVCWQNPEKPPVLIVNGFERVSAPSSVYSPVFAGFMNTVDQGVPDRFDLNFTGRQYDFSPEDAFRNNDGPGFGASQANYETKILPGNTFDFPYRHGRSIQAAGYSFVSASQKAVESGSVHLENYRLVDLILGKERETSWQRPVLDSLKSEPFQTFPKAFQKKITSFCNNGGRLFISGAYVGTDLFRGKDAKSADVQFARNTLRFAWDTGHAAREGKAFSTNPKFWPSVELIAFNTGYRPGIYTVEAPDAISPVKGAKTIFRYAENQFSAGISFSGTYRLVVLGFPFETILDQGQRDRFMKAVLQFLDSK